MIEPDKEIDCAVDEPIQAPKTYLLRWNPTISSFKLDDYRKAIKDYPEGFGCDWSIYEFEKARKGDMYYMLRTGDGNPGIVWRGTFVSDPYEGEDWAGSNRKRMYVNFETQEFEDPDTPLPISIEKLETAIPDIDWHKGHSGQLLTEEQADKLYDLWEEVHPFDWSRFEDEFEDDDEFDDDDDDEELSDEEIELQQKITTKEELFEYIDSKLTEEEREDLKNADRNDLHFEFGLWLRNLIIYPGIIDVEGLLNGEESDGTHSFIGPDGNKVRLMIRQEDEDSSELVDAFLDYLKIE